MITVIKKFDQLTPQEIHAIYKARVDVFVVEQKCPYHEVDDFDLVAMHLLCYDNDQLVAYLRVLPPGTTFKTASIGRVLSLVRHKHYAQSLLRQGIAIAKEKFNANTITIEAQTYARSLYEKAGFEQTSEPFLEDGIEHIQMQYHQK